MLESHPTSNGNGGSSELVCVMFVALVIPITATVVFPIFLIVKLSFK